MEYADITEKIILDSSPPFFLLTVDVEDWFQVENLRAKMPCETWGWQELRVEQNTHRLLDLFDEPAANGQAKLQATFFILGWVAKRCPDLVREIHRRGHEVASHGNRHILCRDEEASSLRDDLAGSKKLLEDIIGAPVLGYRAPGFSIDEQVLALIQEVGYRYDSSYNSFGLNSRYGQVNLSSYPSRNMVFQLSESFCEIPLSNMVVSGRVLPWAGGGYFRFIPFPIFKKGVKKILDRQGGYVFYLHPWEIDPGQPRVAGLPFSHRFRHYINLDKTLSRLRSLISSFPEVSFISCRRLVETVFPPE